MMADSCTFGTDAKASMKASDTHIEIIVRIMQQIIECTYFVRAYYQNKSFSEFVHQFLPIFHLKLTV